MNRNQHYADRSGTSFWQVLHSAAAAAFGVQTANNHERDFEQGKLWHFIVAGFAIAGVFVASIYVLVQFLLSTA